MATTKKRARAKSDGRVGVTLYFDAHRFHAKLVKRVPGSRYKEAATIVERAFDEVFSGSYAHRRGTTSWSKRGATLDEADLIARRLSNFEEVLSVTQGFESRPEKEPPVPAWVKVPKSNAALDLLRRAVTGDAIRGGLDSDISDTHAAIARTELQLESMREQLKFLEERRAQVLETIEQLGG
jgi:hypothetical protein